ncbi:hypothetical protein I4U23_020433 [Adineta vaga]|nr:hypothetical protein I4U23_020433 [Adineta vaga]
MSRRLLMMLIFIIIRFKSKFMIFSLSFDHIEDCFYEKRIHTSLDGYNELHGRWISELDCLDRCIQNRSEKCRSFEHWHSQQNGLCVHANASLNDEPSAMRINYFVNYYEVNCRKDTKAVRLQKINCPGDHLNILVSLNGIDPNYVLLGDSNCKPKWSNETHAQFITHVDNCSLILNNDSIVGKLRWEGIATESNEVRHYGRFFLCPSDIQQIRLAYQLSSTVRTVLTKSTPIPSTTHQRLLSPIYDDDGDDGDDDDDDEESISTSYRISLRWILHNQTYTCPPTCSISLYSLIYVSFDDTAILSSTCLIDSCDFIALYPYTEYLQTRRLISRGCSADPTVIHLSSEMNSLSKFHYSFYLYNIIRELIPFEIQCKLLNTQQHENFVNNPVKCSTCIDNDDSSIIKYDQKDYSYTLFRSLPVNVVRDIPSNASERKKIHAPNSISSSCIIIHQIEYFLISFSFLHLHYWTF